MNYLQKVKLNWYDDRETKRLVNEGEYTFTKPPQGILDLGAHKGFAAEYFAKKFPNIPIHAYEPNARLFEVLKQRMKKYPLVKVFNEAIAGHDGQVSFAISERNVSSHLGEGVQVPCVSLQTAVKRLGVPASVKIDVEGAEFLALSDTTNVQEIVGELHPEKAGEQNSKIRELLSGFSSVTIDSDKKCLFHAVR